MVRTWTEDTPIPWNTWKGDAGRTGCPLPGAAPPDPGLPLLESPPPWGKVRVDLGQPVASSLPEAVLLGLLRRLVAAAPGPLALLPGGGFGGTWGPASRALSIHYMAFLRAGGGWRWGWGPGIELAEGPMSSFCHQEAESHRGECHQCPPAQPRNPAHRLKFEKWSFHSEHSPISRPPFPI